MNRFFAHKPPMPEPDDEPIPDNEPEPEDDPVPHPDPVAAPVLASSSPSIGATASRSSLPLQAPHSRRQRHRC